MKAPRSKRLSFRKFNESDFESIVPVMTDAETMQFTGFRVPQTEEKIKSLLLKWEKDHDGRLGIWAVVSVNQKFVGWAMLKDTGKEHPELGFMITKSLWNQGYATEIAGALIDFAFSELRLPAVIAVTDRNNLASQRVLEKAGMQKVSEEAEIQYLSRAD